MSGGDPATCSLQTAVSQPSLVYSPLSFRPLMRVVSVATGASKLSSGSQTCFIYCSLLSTGKFSSLFKLIQRVTFIYLFFSFPHIVLPFCDRSVYLWPCTYTCTFHFAASCVTVACKLHFQKKWRHQGLSGLENARSCSFLYVLVQMLVMGN